MSAASSNPDGGAYYGSSATGAPAPPPTLLDVFGVLAPPSGAHGVGAGVFGFLTTHDARALRLVCRLCCADVAAARWLDVETRITGSLAAWRACFPGARAANVDWRADLTDADFAHLAGVKTLKMAGCSRITDAGLAHLRGIHTLSIRRREDGVPLPSSPTRALRTSPASTRWTWAGAAGSLTRASRTLPASAR